MEDIFNALHETGTAARVDPRTAVMSTVINYIDRQTISVLLPTLRIALHLTSAHYGMIMTGFMLAYMIGQVPGASCLIGSGYAPGLPSSSRFGQQQHSFKGLPGARLVSESFAHSWGWLRRATGLRGQRRLHRGFRKSGVLWEWPFSTAAQQWGRLQLRR